MNLFNQRALSAVITILTLISFATATTVTAQSLFEVESIDLIVYRDGSVHVTQTLIVDKLAPRVTLSLLSVSVENLIALDENQLSVDYEMDGSNLTVFTLGTERILVEYDTLSLSKKEAEVWTLIIVNPYNLTLFLPQNATVIYLNNMPIAIDTSGTGIKLSLYSGQWEISYVLPLLPEDETKDNGAPWNAIPIEYLIAATAVVTVVVLSALLVVRRRRGPNVEKTIRAHPELKKEDKDVIAFLAERGGKAFEAEIRERFPDTPRTSLWRLVRRLERLEIVEVKRIGLENQVQLRK